MTTQSAVSTSEAVEATSRVTDSLERLVARIHRDLDCDAGESPQITDPYWARVVEDLVDFARECGRVVTDPTVVAVLDVEP